MSSTRTTALVAGALFLLTEIAAIAGMALYQPVLSDPAYVTGPGSDGRVLLGGLAELLLVAAVIGSAATLYPVIKRQNHGLALGYVCARLLEAAIIAMGTISVLTVVTLRQGLADDAALGTVAKALLATHEWTFLFGPNFVLGANSLMLAYLVFRSGLVPRPIAVLGLVGGPLICVSATAVMFGLYEQLSTLGGLAALPVFAWEVSFALYLVTKGFKQAAVAPVATSARTAPANTTAQCTVQVLS
ncbi:DUF4386 domain-containing protein [Actinokineospora xionganensis]|uniref:DUF4386 domain-containing protein n=1 Tax=Actinokineospora xionganensis TaxID=2684470 RepID=A0ABR7L3Y8_9PSEU|nr:DUF4386 domain-containing protein [Actinokineospora xionganensis]MBC6447407.1 DUF4386 domain-containing protein [Actinokineospora xionganensis]